MSLTNFVSQDIKERVDVAAATTGILGGIFVDNLNTVLLVVTIIWSLVRLYETDTVQKLLGKKKNGEETNTE